MGLCEQVVCFCYKVSSLDKVVVTSTGVRGGNIEVEGWKVQTIGCTISYNDVPYITGNAANIFQ